MLLEAGDYVAAAEIAESLWKARGSDVPTLYASAKVLGQCATAAGQDESLAAADKSKRVSSYRASALAALSACREQGAAINAADFPSLELDQDSTSGK